MKDDLGDRLKSEHEDQFRTLLPKNTYGIVRIDGKAFHTFTRSLPRPHCPQLGAAMDAAAMAVCREMMGCKLAYGQSDEYSFVFTDFDRPETEMWFTGNIQKITSVTASIFTAYFNDAWRDSSDSLLATFDARTFTMPSITDVVQYFIWRQNDVIRNSLNMLASCHFSSKELHNKNQKEKHRLLSTVNQSWDDYPTNFRLGRTIRRTPNSRTVSYTHKKTNELITKVIEEHMWSVDSEIPMFDRTGYIRQFVPDQI